MPDFKNGKIYKLWIFESDEMYIGSTTQTLGRRLAKHKNSHNNCASKTLFAKSENVMIELLELHPCENKMYLNKKEGEYIRKLDCINKVIPGRTNTEWKADNKEIISEKLKKKIICELCNCEVNKSQFLRHTKSLRHQGAVTASATLTGSDDTVSGSTTDSTSSA